MAGAGRLGVEVTALATAISARGLQRRYGTRPVLRGLDLEVAAGDTLAIFGSNGAGKTTLLMVLAGLLTPHGGVVTALGEQLPGGIELRRRIGVVAHESLLYADLTARENLAYYARLYGVAASDRVDRLLAEVALSDAADRPAGAFSRGMLQRLALARAVVHEPSILLLDEPFTGLDPGGAEALLGLLESQRKRSVTILLTTHDFERGLACADRTIVLHRGRVAWQSEAELPDARQMAATYARITGA